MANPEHLEMIHRGVEAWNQWRRDNPDIEPNLTGPNPGSQEPTSIPHYLVGYDLHDARLTSQHLGADTDPADLEGANLVGAHLNAVSVMDTAYIVRAPKAIFRKANLEGADLQGANLAGANFEGANLTDAKLHEERVSGNARYVGEGAPANLEGAIFRGANLDGTDLTRAKLKGADFRGCLNLTCEQLTAAQDWELALRDPELACGAPLPDEQIEEIRAKGLELIRTILAVIGNETSAPPAQGGEEANTAGSQSPDELPSIGHNNPPEGILEGVEEERRPDAETRLSKIEETLHRLEILAQEQKPEPAQLRRERRTLSDDVDTFRETVSKDLAHASVLALTGGVGAGGHWLISNIHTVIGWIDTMLKALGVG